MKKFTLFLAIILASGLLVAQNDATTIDQYKWDDPMIFQANPPLITGYGEFSDSLSNEFDGYKFYECNGTYYAINNLADYYYWFVNKYSWKFNKPEIYEYYYLTGNNQEMMKYIYSERYSGKYYPVNIRVEVEGSMEYINNRIKDDKFFADNQRKATDLTKDLEDNKSKNSSSIKNSDQRETITRKYNNIPVIHKTNKVKTTGSSGSSSKSSTTKAIKK